MKRKYAIAVSIIMCVMFIVGLILIFSAPSAGQNAGHTAIVRNGGSMDTSQYHMIINSTTTAYNTGGMVISLIGGLGMLVSGYLVLGRNGNHD